eukprot:jgi/Hompol1/629/HPOL_001263-RA
MDEENNSAMPSFLKSESLDGSLAEAINAVEPNTVSIPTSQPPPSVPVAGSGRAAPTAGRRARPSASPTATGGVSDTTGAFAHDSGSTSLLNSRGNLNKADSSSNDNVTSVLNRADSMQTQLNMQEPKTPSTGRSKSRFMASFDGMLPKFGLGGILRQDGKKQGSGAESTDSESPIKSPSASFLGGTPASGAASSEAFAKKGRRMSRGTAFALNDDIDDEKEKVKWVLNAYRKTTVVGASAERHNQNATVATSRDAGDQVMVVIPDLLDVEDEDMSAMVAAAPNVKTKTLKTIGELESDIAHGKDIASQLQHLSVNGFDLSLLITAALCPPEQLEEPDHPWDWDVIFTQVSSEMQTEQDTMQKRLKGQMTSAVAI